jgi:hypothetical protein
VFQAGKRPYREPGLVTIASVWRTPWRQELAESRQEPDLQTWLCPHLDAELLKRKALFRSPGQTPEFGSSLNLPSYILYC